MPGFRRKKKLEPLENAIGTGVNQSGLRDYNERLLMTNLQRMGQVPGRELARITGLSPQTVSVILRKLFEKGLVEKCEPTKGKVGKPSVPIRLAKDGVLSVGLKIGRRGADFVIMDILGNIRLQLGISYRYPLPGAVFDFLKTSLNEMKDQLDQSELQRLCGIGVAIPYEIWHWYDRLGAPAEEFKAWEKFEFKSQVSQLSDLPVFVINDVTAACQAEHIFGRGKAFSDYAYFYIGAFVGGGIVLNNSIYEGPRKNAGALGSLRTVDRNGQDQQLIETASLFLLEDRLQTAGVNPDLLWGETLTWVDFQDHVDFWLKQTSRELARACLSACAVVDFEAVLIDGTLPENVKHSLVYLVRKELEKLDARGLIVPVVETGIVGRKARAIGAASWPILSKFF